MISNDDFMADDDETPAAVEDSCIYQLDSKLLSGESLLSTIDDDRNIIPAKYDYDESGIYVPYMPHYQTIGCITVDNILYMDDDHAKYGSRFQTADNIYLKIYRVEETRKDILIRCEWTFKMPDGYVPTGVYFNIECEWGEIIEEYAKLDKEGNIKSNKLNQKASNTGRDIGIPASKGSYVAFIDDMRKDILRCSGLEVLKDKDYEWPDVDATDEEDRDENPSCFSDYPEDVQEGAMYLINNNLLLDNIISTVASIQYGSYEVRRSLILTATTPYVLESIHTLLDGKRGGGKTQLMKQIVKSYPNADIFEYQTFSAKNIFYDKDKFNPEGVNILILDDPNLNSDERVETLKILSDNEKTVKTLNTVINQKAEEFQLTGKFLIIITYAKEIPDEELANRLHNTSLIIADSEKIPIKNKIKNNAVSDIKNNAAVMKMREYNKAAIHYLSERHMKIFNPWSIFINVDEYNNRDITDLISLILANGFFKYSELKSITVNDDMELVIGSFNEVADNLKVWEADAYQSEKLSSRQKEIMDMLPAYTDEEAEDKVMDVLANIPDDANVNFKMREIEKELYTINRIAKEMELSTSTVNNALNRNHKEGSNVRSLAEMDLVHKIQVDSSYVQTHPNIFYKPIRETEGASSDDDDSSYVAMYNAFTKLINTLEGKQTILINLLIYVNITLNKTGYMYLKKYCSDYDERMTTDDYDSYYDFIANFMDGLNEDHCIDIETASIHDLRIAADEMKKIKTYIPAEIYDKNTKLSNIPENALNENQTEDGLCKTESHSLHSSSFKNKERIEAMRYDFNIIQKLSDILRIRWITAEEILKNHYELFDISEDGHNEELVVGIANSLKRMYDDKLANRSMRNGQMHYTMNERQYNFINEKVPDGSDAG